MLYIHVELSKWDVAREVARILGPGWLFRGHSDSSWHLTTAFEREAKRVALERHYFQLCEHFMYERFISGAHNYSSNPNIVAPIDVIDQLGKMQHHGCVTRLMDVTRSFYVGAYFALSAGLDEKKKDVWAINFQHLYTKAQTRVHAADESKVESSGENLFEKYYPCRGVNSQKELRGTVFPASPRYANERMLAQQAMFLCPLSVSNPFDQNLFECLGLDSTEVDYDAAGTSLSSLSDFTWDPELTSLIRLTFAGECAHDALQDLAAIGVDERTLFPGLDGFARSINSSVRLFPAKNSPFSKHYEDWMMRKVARMWHEQNESAQQLAALGII